MPTTFRFKIGRAVSLTARRRQRRVAEHDAFHASTIKISLSVGLSGDARVLPGNRRPTVTSITRHVMNRHGQQSMCQFVDVESHGWPSTWVAIRQELMRRAPPMPIHVHHVTSDQSLSGIRKRGVRCRHCHREASSCFIFSPYRHKTSYVRRGHRRIVIVVGGHELVRSDRRTPCYGGTI